MQASRRGAGSSPTLALAFFSSQAGEGFALIKASGPLAKRVKL